MAAPRGEIWKWIAGIAVTALLTGAGTAWAVRGDVLDSLNSRPTKAETRRIVEKEAPYTKDRELILKSLSQGIEERKELRSEQLLLTKSVAQLTGELRAFIARNDK